MKYSTKTERFVHWAIGGLASCFMGLAAVGQTVVTQSTPIAINDNGPASPFPSTNLVQNTLGTIEKVTVTLNGVSHGYPDDIDISLVSPDGTPTTLMSDAGGQFDLINTTITLDNSAATALPDEAQINNGTYKPANYDGFGTDTITGGYPADLSVFNGKTANGTWLLYVGDDTVQDAGSIASWSLNLYLSPTLSITNGPLTINEDAPTTINVFVNDTDTPLPNLSLTATSSSQSIIADSGLSFGGNTGGTNRTLTITPVANANGGPVTITVTLKDEQNIPVSIQMPVTVAPVNDAPALTLATASTSIPQGGISTNIAVQVLDVDSDPQGVVLTATSSNPSVIAATNVLFGRLAGGTAGTNRVLQIAANDAIGNATLTIIATDSSGGSSSNTISVTVTSVPSVVRANPASITIPDGGTATAYPSTITVPNSAGLGLVGKVIVSLVGVEHPNPADLGVLLVGPNGGSVVLMRNTGSGFPVGLGDTNDVRLTFDKDAPNIISAAALATGSYRTADLGSGDFPAPAPVGPYSPALTFQGAPANGNWQLFVYDTTGNSATGQIAGGWTLQIFPAPTLGPIGNQTTLEDTAATITFPVGDFDGSVTNIAAQVVNLGDAANVSLSASFSGNTGTLVITPSSNFNTGTPAVPVPIIVTVQDSSGFATTSTFNLTVTPVNDPPSQDVIQKQITRAGQSVGPVSFGIRDPESPGSALVVTATSDNPKLLPTGSIILGGTGDTRTITIFPSGTIAGQANVTVTVTDPSGASNSQSFNLAVGASANPLFENTGRIVINDATVGGSAASPYPAPITVSGLIGQIADIQVTLFGITHPTPDDLDILLVGPMGTNIVLLSDAGGNNGITNVTLVFRGNALSAPDDNNQIVSGVYLPANYDVLNDFPFAGSPGANASSFANFQGANPNGVWSLYIVDDTQGPKGGAIEGGWQLGIRTHSFLPNIPDQITQEDTQKRFSVQVGDVQPGVTNTVTASVTVPGGQQQVILPSGIATSITDGILTVTLNPIADANGTNSVTLTLTDPDGFTTTKSFNFGVTPVDDAPRFSNITAKSTSAATPVSFNFDVADPEGTSVSVVGSSSDQNLVKDSNIVISPAAGVVSTRTISISPEGIASGSVTITLVATDSTSQKATTTFTLTVNPTLAFQNPGGRIVINDFNVATPYPSTIDVSGVSGTVSGVSVILVGFSHPFPSDVDVLLVSPDNKAIMLMSDAGTNIPASNLRLAFAAGNTPVPAQAALASGTYSPANYVDPLIPNEGDEMPSPAPARPAGGYSVDLNTLAGINPNGQWKLFVRDDTFPDGGVIEGGWILNIHTAPTVSQLGTQTALEDTPLAVPFTVFDQDTPASGVAVTFSVDDSLAPGLIVPSNVSLATNGFNYTLTILASTNRPFGTSPETNSITLNVTDGTSSASTSFQVRVIPVDDPPSVTTATNRVITLEDTPIAIAFTIRDADSTIGTSSNVVVFSSNTDLVPNSTNNITIAGPDNQAASNSIPVTVTVKPAANQSGSTILSFVVSDRSQSVTNSVEVDVTAVNDLPTISFPTMATVSPGTNVIAGGTINNLPVTVGDVETPAKNLGVVATSSDQSLIPNQNVFVGGSGPDRTITLTTVGASTGNVTISVVATDEANGKTTNTFLVTITPSPASVFANASSILIPGGADTAGNASVYPSKINVSGLSGNVSKISVTLDGLTHTAPDDIDILLVSPAGKKIILLSDVGGANPISNVRLLFDQSGRGLADDAQIVSGTYQPADFEVGNDTFPAPAPVGPYANSLQEFIGSNPNGDWSLYIVDDASGNVGQLAFGWSLRIETAPTIVLDSAFSLNAPAGSPTYAQFTEDTVYHIRFTIGDGVTPPANLAVLFSSSTPNLLSPILTTLAGNVVTAELVSLPNAFGTNNLTITVQRSDGAQSSIVVPINITPVNDPVTVSRFTDKTTSADTALTVPILVSDVDTALSNIWVRATSGNEAVISSTNILIAGRTNFLKGVVANFDPVTWVSSIVLVPNSVSGSSTITIDVFEINGAVTNIVTSTFVLTVTPVNHAPTISAIASPQPVEAGKSSTNIVFSVGDSDNDTLTITATSSDQSLVRDSDILVNTLVGAPGGRTVRVTTQTGVQGDAVITLNVRDPGNLRASTQFTLRVVPTRERLFTSTQPIQIRDNNSADPYPSRINVSGFSGNVSKLTVTLNGFAHTFPDDVDILLVSPTGQKVLLMSDAGGGTAVTNLVIKFDDTGTGAIPDQTVLTSGTFPPVNFEGNSTDNFASTVPPGPAGPYASTMSAFNGISPNGDWSLYIIDDTPSDFGVITGGWSLGVTTLPALHFAQTDVTSPEDRPASVDFTIAEESFGNPGAFTFSVSSTNAAVVPSNTTNIVVTGSGTNRTVTVIPAPNASGTTLITITEQSSGVSGQFRATFTPVNDQPVISQVPDQTVVLGSFVTVTNFNYSDVETAKKDLVVTFASSDSRVIPASNIAVIGNDLRIFSGAGIGTAVITVTVADQDGASTSMSFNVTVTAGQNPLFANTDGITINDRNPATPYPSTISVNGVGGRVASVSVTLRGLTHSFPDDVDILLVGPNNQGVVLMSDAGAGGNSLTSLVNAWLIFDDGASQNLPDNSGIIPFSVYKPTDFEVSNSEFAAPAPAGPYSATFNGAFSGIDPNGTWSLYVQDDASPDAGSLSGWSLNIVTTAPTISAIGDQILAEDTPKTIAFTVFDGDTPATNLVVTATQQVDDRGPLLTLDLSGTDTNRSITLTPTPHVSGTTRVTVSVTDGNSTNQTIFNVVITPVNDAPVISGLSDTNTPANIPLRLNFTVTDEETPSSELVVTATSSNDLLGTVRIDNSGSTPALLFSPTGVGSSSVTISVVASDGVNFTTNSFNIGITPSAGPGISAIPNQSTTENTPVLVAFTITPTSSPNIVLSSSFSNPNLVSKITLGGTGNNRTALIELVPGRFGFSEIDITITDDFGSATSAFALIVHQVPQPPVIGPILDRSTDEDVPVVIDLPVSDPDTALSALTFDWSASNTNLVSSVTFDQSGATVIATVNLVTNQSGLSAVTIFVSDGTFATNRTFALNVRPVDDPPSIQPIPDQITNEDVPLTFEIFVSDPDTQLSDITFTGVSSNTNLVSGITFVNSGSNVLATLTLVSNANILTVGGRPTITITAKEGTNSSSQSFLLNVVPVPDAPTLAPIGDLSASAGGTVTLPLVVSDPDTAISRLNFTGQSSNPSLVANIRFNNDGTNVAAVITLIPNILGTAAITITVSDGTTPVSQSFVLTAKNAAAAAHLAAHLTGSDLNITVTGTPGSTYIIEGTSDFKTWSTLGQVIIDADGSTDVQVGTFKTYQFFRAKNQ